MPHDYKKGLTQVGKDLYAWMLPDGGWGWSNSGLIVGDGESLVVDTLFDLALTKEMLNGYRAVHPTEQIRYVFNTHANGDHYFGNELLKEHAIIVATKAAAADMAPHDVQRLEDMKRAAGQVGDYFRDIFGPFDFSNIQASGPDIAFDDELQINVGGRTVILKEVGPAHSAGDAVAYVPDEGVVYAGDILFIGGTPIVWAGPVASWITACDTLIALDADTYVPGHGPVTDKQGVKEVRDYLAFVEDESKQCFKRGMPINEAISSIAKNLGRFGGLGDKERLAQNVIHTYKALDPSVYGDIDPLDAFSAMAALHGHGKMPDLERKK